MKSQAFPCGRGGWKILYIFVSEAEVDENSSFVSEAEVGEKYSYVSEAEVD